MSTPHDKHNVQPSHSLPLAVNLAGVFCLAILIALGVYLHQGPYLVGGKSSPGFSAIHTDVNSWNVGCTVLGTAVGLLLAWGFSSYDELLSRRELESPRGILAMYLRPLTAKRGWQQLRRRRFPATRTFFILATIVSSLTSAATVAVFGIHTQMVTITNPYASYSLAQLPAGGAVRNADQSINFVTTAPEVTLLSSFLYRDAYIRASQAKGRLWNVGPGNYLSESGTIGSTNYPGLNTSGIGLNMSSYIQYSGPSDGYNLPTSYTFKRTDAAVFGTIVDVTCSNATASWSIKSTKYGNESNPQIVSFDYRKKGFGPTTVIYDRSSTTSFNIGSNVNDNDGDPIHGFFFAGNIMGPPFVLECKYGGHEILATVSLEDSLSPLRVNGTVTQGSPLSSTVKQQLANIIDQYMTIHGHGGPGGSLADGWVAADYGYLSQAATIEKTMAQVLGELGEAYYSLLRQNVENANLVRDGAAQIPDNGSYVKMVVSVLRVGGSSPAWFIIYGLLFVAAMLGAVLAAIQRRALPWAPQDPVELLQKVLPAAVIDELTPLRYGGQIEVAHGHTAGDGGHVATGRTE
ncbi:hypothetical protein PLICBS_010120 [Purpureocillium lilacinum]|uniref:uncharacterized protein n=1 Tax=Purpureocillium lilacinum TaxID=33203 RepID=UPI00208C8B96|nr:hypothetical protein PLICBS_010120 [Purpureocillium lilacinum]